MRESFSVSLHDHIYNHWLKKKKKRMLKRTVNAFSMIDMHTIQNYRYTQWLNHKLTHMRHGTQECVTKYTASKHDTCVIWVWGCWQRMNARFGCRQWATHTITEYVIFPNLNHNCTHVIQSPVFICRYVVKIPHMSRIISQSLYNPVSTETLDTIAPKIT